MTFYKPLNTGLCVALHIALGVALYAALLSSCHQPEQPVTEQEALNFAKKIEVSVSKQDKTVLDGVIDEKYFAALVLRQAKQGANPDLAQKAKDALKDIHFGQNAIAATRKIGTYWLFRHYEKEGRQHLVFRLFRDNGDINYHDFELIRGDQGIRADDVYVYSTGDLLSKTETESLLEDSEAANMTAEEKGNLLLAEEAIQDLNAGNAEKADSFYDQIPDKAKKERQNQRLHIRIAEKLGDNAEKAALTEYKTNFPADPFVYCTTYRWGEFHKNYATALEGLNGLDSLLKGDPFLDFIRGMTYKMMNDPLQSKIALERFHALWPAYVTAIGELIDIHMNAGHPDSAALLIKETENFKNITQDQVDGVLKKYPTIRPYLK